MPTPERISPVKLLLCFEECLLKIALSLLRLHFWPYFQLFRFLGPLRFANHFMLTVRREDLMHLTYVTNSLLDSYAKCGCIESALRLYEEISVERKNLVSWTSIISGFAMRGMGKENVEYFSSMEQVGLKPNRVTLLSIFNASSHGGLIDEGLNFFGKMVDEYEIALDIKHYGCLIDMLGRAGRLEEAENMALEIPSNIVNVVIWRTLLGACSFHGNVEMDERVTKKILQMERGYGGDYVLMSNIFAGVGRLM